MLLPWIYLKECFDLITLDSSSLAKKLTSLGLETSLVKKKKETYLEFVIPYYRLDLLSWWGIVNEISILLDYSVKEMVSPSSFAKSTTEYSKLFNIQITSLDCQQFGWGIIENINQSHFSSSWLVDWLIANKFDSTNNIIVDGVNLAMIETGYCIYVFDYDSLLSDKNQNNFVIRQVQKGETITFPREKSELIFQAKEETIITFNDKVIGLAGLVSNCQTSAPVTSKTKKILVIVSYFNPESIKKTIRRFFFETGPNFDFAQKANILLSPLQIFMRIMNIFSLSIRTNFTEKIDTNKHENLVSYSFFSRESKETFSSQKIIKVSQTFLNQKIGQNLSQETLENIWKRLRFTYQKENEIYQIGIPSYRSDIVIAENLVEEILKIYDYNRVNNFSWDNFQTVSLLISDNQNIRRREKIKNLLANNGWQEIITYSLISSKSAKDFSIEDDDNDLLYLSMPKNERYVFYRRNMLANHLEVIARNLIYEKDLFFFETTFIYDKNCNEEEILFLTSVGKVINQPLHNLVSEVDYFWIKGMLEKLFLILNINEKVIFDSSNITFLQSAKSVKIFLDQEKIGYLGQLDPSFSDCYQIHEPVWIAQISLTKIWKYLSKYPTKVVYEPISNFPISKKDLSFLFPDSINYSQVIKAIKEIGGNNLCRVDLKDVYYRPEWTKLKKKSVTFSLVFQSPIRTLRNEEIIKLLKNISQVVNELFKSELRE